MDVSNRLAQALADSYRLERELGAGGMATVYLAHDLKHGRPVALKVLHADLGHALGPERFRREIEIAARLQHPNILTVFDSGEHEGRLWYTMPFVTGESLRDRMEREGELSLESAIGIVREVAEALDCAHAQGVIHRDIKPENILLSGGHALVADFGIARALSDEGGRLTATGLALGTPAYMSPEQGEGDRRVESRSDVYSLACVTYEMLTGEPPYSGPTARAVMTKRLTDPVPSPRRLRQAIPVALDLAIQRGLAPTPADRFASAGEFARALSAGSDAPAPHGAPRRVWRFVAAAVVIAVAFGAWLARPRGGRAHRPVAPPGVEAHLARGNFLVAKRTPVAVREAIGEYEAVLAVDSANAAALAKLGYAYGLFVDWGWEFGTLRPAELRVRALDFSTRALAADSGSADAWLTRAYLLVVDDPYRLRGAVPAFERSLAIDSTSAEAWYQYGQALMILGRSADAATAYRRSFGLDPNRPLTLMSLSSLFSQAGRYAEARALVDSAVAASRTVISPYVLVVRGLAKLRAGEAAAAQADGEVALAMDSVFTVPARALLSMAYAAQGHRARAATQADSLLLTVGRGEIPTTTARFAAAALVYVGRIPEALSLIERARPRGAQLWYYLQSRDFDGIRELPRFRAVAREADPRPESATQ